MTRTKRTSLLFRAPFKLAGVDHALPAGTYEIIADEELIEGLSFPVYRRVATWIMAPSAALSGTEMLAVEPGQLAQAHDLDSKLSPRSGNGD